MTDKEVHKTILADTHSDDKQRLQFLLKKCSAPISLGDDAIKYFDEAIALAGELKDGLANAQLHILYAKHNDLHGESSKAMQLLNSAMKLLIGEAETNEVNELIAESHFTLGVVHKKLNANHHALQAFLSAADMYRKTTNQDGLAKALIRLGGVKNETGNTEDALADISAALQIAEALSNGFRISHAHNSLGNVFFNQGNFTLALKHFLKALPFTESSGNVVASATLYRNIGNVYLLQSDYERAEEYHKNALESYRSVGNSIDLVHQLTNLGSLLLRKQKYSDAKKHLNEAIDIATRLNAPNILGYTYFHLGNVYFEEHNVQQALKCYQQALAINTETEDKRNMAQTLNGLANAVLFTGSIDEAEPYLLQAIEVTRDARLQNEEKDALKLLAEVRKQQRRFAEALALFERYATLKESLLNADKIREAEALQTQMAIENKAKEVEIERLRNVELRQAYDELKATQHKLIQQEKLASLGQLTAGVAHEIQNPLNFVNNYSDISVELMDELANATNDEERQELIVMLRNNLQSIYKNGSRASGIVKSMLEHSNAGNSERVLSDVNHIVREHLQFALSGFKAAGEGFECLVETNYGGDLPELTLSPGEIGKVLLNVFNNAFYELRSIKRSNTAFQPAVSVVTATDSKHITISITDNGNGIIPENSSLIFEPFFTTKPTGEGVGLGLSISNDIIQSHAGTIEVETPDSGGARFIIRLPVG